MKISAVIITRNEEKNIGRCLQSLLQVTDEIVVADSHSSDATQDICKQFGVKFFSVEWMGYAATKNHANSLASYDMILSIDADEELSVGLQQSILELRKNESGSYFKCKRKNNYCGQWIHYSGWQRDVKPRIFDRRTTLWQGDFVHEKLVNISGENPELLQGDLLHYSYRTIGEHFVKAKKYATLSAEEKLTKGIKPSYLRIIYVTPVKFLENYFIRLGMLDGWYGLVLSVIYAYEKYYREKMLFSLYRNRHPH